MSLENKIEGCIWKGCLTAEARTYGKKRGDYDLTIDRQNSFLYKTCKSCNGKNLECKYYLARKK